MISHTARPPALLSPWAWGLLTTLLLVGGGRAQQEVRPTHLIQRLPWPRVTEKLLTAKSREGWLLAGAVKADDREGGYLCYFVPNPAGRKEVRYTLVSRATDYDSAAPLNVRGNKGWQLAALVKGEGPQPYLYCFTEGTGTYAHGILTAKKLVAPEVLDRRWGKAGFRLVGLIPSAVEPGSYKYYIILPSKGREPQQHCALSTRVPPAETRELDRVAQKGWRLAVILPTADQDQPYLFWFHRERTAQKEVRQRLQRLPR